MSQKDDAARRLAETYAVRFATRTLYADMDAFRHLNNGAIGRYFEEGRADLNMRLFGVECMIDPPGGLQLLFANVIIDFLLQAHYPGTIEIGTGIARIGNSSYVVAQGAFQNGACFALAEAVMVHAIHGRPTPLPDAARAIAETLRIAAAA